jgi:hypothetical protein
MQGIDICDFRVANLIPIQARKKLFIIESPSSRLNWLFGAFMMPFWALRFCLYKKKKPLRNSEGAFYDCEVAY